VWRKAHPIRLLRADISLQGANLVGADLRRADLISINLQGANLVGVDLREATLALADLDTANLSGAKLDRADLRGAILDQANLSGAELVGANLCHARLSRTELSAAVLLATIFGDVDLTSVIGLERCIHRGPSIIDHQTLQQSGPLPLPFLRGVGLPDNLIEYLPSLLNQAVQLYSCFISYSAKDDDFAKRIHADLQNNGVRCWFAPHDLPIGEKILDAVDQAIRSRDKVLLILSKNAIKSDWVEDEVKKALEEEKTRRPKQTVLFPIRLDDAVMKTKEAWAGLVRRDRNIDDFTRWKEHDAYKQSFERVVRDLTITPAAPGPR
jgi:uncharacterized protein YjbI with pentapeptide repeats